MESFGGVVFDLTPDSDPRLPACTVCDYHPMHPERVWWRCPECAAVLLPNDRDPVWPWETYEEGRVRWLKRNFE